MEWAISCFRDGIRNRYPFHPACVEDDPSHQARPPSLHVPLHLPQFFRHEATMDSCPFDVLAPSPRQDRRLGLKPCPDLGLIPLNCAQLLRIRLGSPTRPSVSTIGWLCPAGCPVRDPLCLGNAHRRGSDPAHRCRAFRYPHAAGERQGRQAAPRAPARGTIEAISRRSTPLAVPLGPQRC